MRGTVILLLTACLTGCTHSCPLGLHTSQLLQPLGEAERVPCCGGFAAKDLPLLPSTEGEVDITNVTQAPEPVDVFLVPTSCTKLFDGDYPSGHPLCQVYIGPLTANSSSGRVSLNAGTYRLWMQAYSTNTATSGYEVQIDVLDYRCLPVIP